MEVEYIALSTAMHDLIPLRTLVDEVKKLMNADILPCQTFSKVFEDNNGALVLAANNALHDSTVKTHHCQISFLYGTCFSTEKFILRKSHMDNQIADCLTQGLDKTLFEHAHQMLVGLVKKQVHTTTNFFGTNSCSCFAIYDPSSERECCELQ